MLAGRVTTDIHSKEMKRNKKNAHTTQNMNKIQRWTKKLQVNQQKTLCLLKCQFDKQVEKKFNALHCGWITTEKGQYKLRNSNDPRKEKKELEIKTNTLNQELKSLRMAQSTWRDCKTSGKKQTERVDRSDWARNVKNIMRMDRLTKYLEKILTKCAKEQESGESNQNRR